MNDTNKDKLIELPESELTLSNGKSPEKISGKESENTEGVKSETKKFTLEKGIHRILPTKARKTIKPIPMVQDETVIKIEKILEQGLAEQYAKLTPIGKQEFKIKGEATAVKIKDLLQSTHVKVKKILLLIIEWLKILPGINKFFLEQEAKIKTDQIVELHKKQKEKHSHKLL